MVRLLPILALSALLAPPPAPPPELRTPVIIYSADIPIHAIRRMGAMRIEVSPEGVRAGNHLAHGWVSDDGSHLAVRWNRPPLRASLPREEVSNVISAVLSAEERIAMPDPRLERLADPRDSILGYPAELYRVRFGPRSWVDVWITRELERSEEFSSLLPLAVTPFSPGAAELVRQIPGVPLHVELRSQRLGRVDLLRLVAVGQRHSIPRGGGFALPVPFARLLLRVLT